MKRFLFLLLILNLVGCGKDNNYVHVVKNQFAVNHSETYALAEDTGKVDILWVIDNSGSMSGIQQEVILNMDKFIKEFTKNNRQLDWRMGLISTSQAEAPYIGFNTPFDYTDPDPVANFSAAVARLGTGGDAWEKSLDPVMDKLDAYPNFLRSNAFLIIVMVSDEEEQSSVKPADFLSYVIKKKMGNPKLFKAFGAFNASDLGCSSGTVFNYGGTNFETIINQTSGKVYTTCTPDFGLKLADLGKEIVSTVSSPVILLKEVPVPSTIKVSYKGVEMPGGPAEAGGFWYYDPEINGIRFHTLDFVDFNSKFAQISFVIKS